MIMDLKPPIFCKVKGAVWRKIFHRRAKSRKKEFTFICDILITAFSKLSPLCGMA